MLYQRKIAEGNHTCFAVAAEAREPHYVVRFLPTANENILSISALPVYSFLWFLCI
jgi:hypothetical protein